MKILPFTKLKPIFCCLCILSFTNFIHADTWRDPSWKEMLDSSDLVALVQYTSNGTFQASARIISIYKGQTNIAQEIWISGFSNRYGPIDSMQVGDEYLVFLLKTDYRGKIPSWMKSLNKNYQKAYREGRTYRVWSPTSGDLKKINQSIQYDLLQTSNYASQNIFAFKPFEDFLKAYYGQQDKKTLIQHLIEKINPFQENDAIPQTLMQLYFLGFNEYLDVFKNYSKVQAPASKYALAHLLGNVKTDQSRNLLIALLDDEHSLVQGEAVRQLKYQPAELIGPILTKKLGTSSETNFGPSNIMNPVMNRIDGGKVEIIKTLTYLRYKEAIPALLPLLETTDDWLFELVVNALKELGSKAYVPYFNQHLDRKEANLIFGISTMIAKDSLVECLPHLKKFIATCNRNGPRDFDYIILECCGIGRFKDSSTIAFLFQDFDHFFAYKDTIESSDQNEWLRNYLSAFASFKSTAVRPKIFKILHDWHGLNEDFGKYPQLFRIKQQLEDSLRMVFKKKWAPQGYTLNHCMALITNTSEVGQGQLPVAEFMVEIGIPDGLNGDEQKLLFSTMLNTAKSNVFIRFKEGFYHLERQERFDSDHMLFSPLGEYLKYVEKQGQQSDLAFLDALLKSSFVKNVFDKKQISRTLNTAKENLKNTN